MSSSSSSFALALLGRARSLGLVMMGFLAAVGVLSLSRINPAQAQGPGVKLQALYNQVQTL